MLAFPLLLLLPVLVVAKPLQVAPALLVTERYLLQRQDTCSSCTDFTTAVQNCVSSDPTGTQPSTIACICSTAILSPIQTCYTCLGSEGASVPDALQSSVDQLTSTCRAAGYEVPDINLGGSSSIAVASSSAAQASSEVAVASSSAVVEGTSSARLSASAAASSATAPRVSPSVRTTSIPATASATGSTGAGAKRVKGGGVAILLGAAAVAFLV